MHYYLGLDNGGTTTKAAIFDIKGKEIGVASISTKMITPKVNYVERDMEEMWQANCQVIREALHKTGLTGDDIAGIGVCGHGKGLYLWGLDGKPVRNGIISTDNRAYEYIKKWKNDGTEERAMEISCQHVLAMQPVSLLAWLKDNEPDNYNRIKYVFECKDYIRYRLTGEAKAEYTDYSGANFLNLRTRKYDEELLRIFGIEEISEALPPLCTATEIAGYVTKESADICGLNEGTPVIGGMFDIDACALGVGITDENYICMIAGTWSINEYLRKAPVLNETVRMNSLFALPNYYLIEESSPTSAGNSEWFVKHFVSEKRGQYDELNDWVESIPPEEFIPVFLPFLMASNVHPNAKACFVGISTNHTEKHLLRSVYEGIVFCHKMHLENLLESKESIPKAVRLAGGAAHSKVWTKMFADILQLPVQTVKVNETGALGCAVAVAVAVGDYRSIEEAVDGMCDISAPVMPEKKLAGIYDAKYRLYKKTINSLNTLWDEMQEVIVGGY